MNTNFDAIAEHRRSLVNHWDHPTVAPVNYWNYPPTESETESGPVPARRDIEPSLTRTSTTGAPPDNLGYTRYVRSSEGLRIPPSPLHDL
jgi:hypothetical protein